ncbi:hypothetical protein [Lacisediminimonas sp.]|uniref:hypothetical protein n=1 Tax=Lacisediminimonas sp. TaxID=3060582 RepID=UPI00271D969F|nr:hypothetical protein [Lacisediminimonas sp.]MDO8299700.1 hypothetical protein [Lacisediminimonas sp.]MDO9218048.1 hypothetical protein [Lacisediminimonas sp.]
MPIQRARSIALTLISGCTMLAAATAVAQPRADAPPPPRLERLEEGQAPAVTIPGRSTEQKIEDKRENGRITSTTVRTGGSTYTVTPNTPKGSALPGDVQSTSNRPPQWKVLEFSTDPKKDQRNDAPAATPSPPANQSR